MGCTEESINHGEVKVPIISLKSIGLAITGALNEDVSMKHQRSLLNQAKDIVNTLLKELENGK